MQPRRGQQQQRQAAATALQFGLHCCIICARPSVLQAHCRHHYDLEFGQVVAERAAGLLYAHLYVVSTHGRIAIQ